LIAVPLYCLQRCRESVQLLIVRAMLRLGEGRPDEAWQDLLACHRLGRLLGRSGTFIEGLVGNAIEGPPAAADLAFLDRAWLDADQVKACLRDLRELPPLVPAADKLDFAERLLLLETFMILNRRGSEFLATIAPDFGLPKVGAKGVAALDDVNWDPALRGANRLIDRLVGVLRVKDRAAREQKLNQLGEEMRDRKAKLVSSGILEKVLRGDKAVAHLRGEVIGEALVSNLVPGIRKFLSSADRVEQVRRNLEVAFALTAYRRDHGRYPQKLEALAPAYLAQIPGDVFSGQALIYRPSEKGFLFYSVGMNGLDEQGRSYGDEPPGDDLPVRMPLPKVSKQ
jgi:hypothetical protein